ncbi:hypothetical protein DCS_00829 [Drechmeria coniospora]|uniref:Ribosome biogenesis protein Urb1 n=1 Tax=Drechmeria coniospora TaxID=98403 RepID=A0A151GRF5_DRECN|nr:hypothetical protein DCS_00829 [Drechmeria coniospora]KYK59695.1 hypothetical protein DCS_00829 [Drechmeria coniospora]
MIADLPPSRPSIARSTTTLYDGMLTSRDLAGLQSFKKLLDDIIAEADADADASRDVRKANLVILQQYLDAVKPRDAGDDAVFLGDIMDMWSFAAQVGDHGVMSSVAVVLALLLRVVSESLHLVSHGLGLCHTLLQERQLKSLVKNLTSEKSKAFVISPTLRLLREAVSLDGGVCARKFFRERAHTFASLGRNLELGHAPDASPDDGRKASVRTNAVRFFLTCLKYLHSQGRKELLAQREHLSHLTYMIKSDPPSLVLEIIDGLKSHLLMDMKIPRELKFRNFNTKTLLRFLALYGYTCPAHGADQRETVVDKVHQFLLFLCTTPAAGVLYPYKGLYPKDDGDDGHLNGSKAQGDHDADASQRRTRVFNFVLSEFAAKLRPWSSLKHSELLVAIFTAAPELIADYFYNNRSFTFEPRLSMTWIGYASFLFSTMTIPLPPSFGDATRCAAGPPPTSIVLDTILPPAINEKVLVRCLSPKSNLTSFFATRILVAALEKLDVAVKMLHSSSSRHRNSPWSEAARKLLDSFCQRAPDMKEIVRCYRSIPPENALHKALASRLLRLYYEVIPRVALAANFDVSALLVDTLKGLYRDSHEPGIKSLAAMELESLVHIASYSPGMRWFVKMDGLGEYTSLSAFTALLRLLSGDGRDAPHRQLRSILSDVAVENQLVCPSVALRPLLRALRCAVNDADAKEADTIWNFVDNCISRCANSPIKYLDQLISHSHAGQVDMPPEACPPSLLSFAFAEQIGYATGTTETVAVRPLARFISLYFNACHIWEGESPLLQHLHQTLRTQLSSKSAKMARLGDARDLDALRADDDPSLDVDGGAVANAAAGSTPALSESDLHGMLHTPFPESADASALTKWASISVDDLVEDGWATSLIRLLSSPHTSIRKESLTNILKLAAQIKESSQEGHAQIWLLLSELTESCKVPVEHGPVPSAFTAFAIHAIQVLREPLHPLYPKINSFLTRSPVWSLEKLPLAHDILHGEPSEDDKYYAELTWLLAYLLDSLQTAFDLGVFHKKKWFEKILGLASNPFLRVNLRTRIQKIIYRTSCLDEGSTTLATRFGMFSWLDAQQAAFGRMEEAAVYQGLTMRLWETCDQETVIKWSNGGIKTLIQGGQVSEVKQLE